MDEHEISVTFFADKNVMEQFKDAIQFKEKELGIKLSKKQALQIAIKEAISNWQKTK